MFLAIRDIRFAKGRFAMMGGVVALITLLLVMLSGLTAGLAEQSTSAIDRLGALASRQVDTIAFGAPGSGTPKASYTESSVTAAQVDSWQHQPGVQSAEPLGITQTRAQAANGSGTANVAVFGVSPGSPLAPVDVSAGTAAVGASIAEALSVGQGDKISLGGVELSVAVVVPDQWYSHTGVVWTALPAWAKASHVSDGGQLATVIAVTYSAGSKVDEGAADAAAHTASESRTGSFQALGSFKSENGSLTLMQAFLYGISSLVIVAFLTVWTIQRTRDIAVLKAMGAPGSYILRDAMTQAAVVLLAGAALGGAVGVAAGALAAQAAPFLLTAGTTVVPVVGIVALGLAGAALAVRRATKVDALLALGGN
ncbi:FtsX-like permease family protein [Arthrobacter liuii]|uniref:ABC transporter substrate-binding protein n=1 Tax=Arthrobacter liuii TaxID=1476996 RepID=A0ABQ2AZ03_9MICC|nr:FtsX-like permease family protein [Arthrobacter liuii]GGI00575.1 ABC transporter substrate-binding protein [Arthrobacter liuii]